MINNNDEEEDDEGEEVNAPIQTTPTLTLAPIQGSDTPTQLPIRSQSALDPSGECLRSVFLSFCSFQWSCYIIFTGASTNEGAGPVQQSMDLGNVSYLIVKWYVKTLTFFLFFCLLRWCDIKVGRDSGKARWSLSSSRAYGCWNAIQWQSAWSITVVYVNLTFWKMIFF